MNLEAIGRHPGHGYSIAQRIKERSSGVLDFKEGTVESYEGVE